MFSGKSQEAEGADGEQDIQTCFFHVWLNVNGCCVHIEQMTYTGEAETPQNIFKQFRHRRLQVINPGQIYKRHGGILLPRMMKTAVSKFVGGTNGGTKFVLTPALTCVPRSGISRSSFAFS
jgi:hypothetical protein